MKICSQKGSINAICNAEQEVINVECDLCPSGDAPSEVMSSSTISRAEENARLKDLEETFEERYTKVKYHIILQNK
jgi:hypothetical protein